MSSSTNETPPPARRNRRGLLKDYYGLAEGAGDGGAPSSSSASAPIGASASSSVSVGPRRTGALSAHDTDPLDIDSDAYHPELAFNTATKELALVEVIRRDNQLVSEIKNLDGNMKTLVYENYNKFIAATDTIRRMKTNAEEMAQQMTLLESKVKEISTSVDTIHGVLGPPRARIHQLSGVHTLIKKLNFVFDLPTKLMESSRKRQYAQTVLLYAKTGALLNHYRHIPVFQQIEDECAGIMVDVGRRVREKMVSEKTLVRQVSECAGLMLGLALMPPVDIAKEYLFRAGVQLDKIVMVETAALVAAMADADATGIAAATDASEIAGAINSDDHRSSKVPRISPKSEPVQDPSPGSVRSESQQQQQEATPVIQTDPLVGRIIAFDKAFLAEFAAVVGCYEAYFVRPRDPSNTSPASLNSIEALKSNMYAKNMSDEDRMTACQALSKFIDAMENKYFALVERLLQLPDDISRVSPTLYVSVLQVIRQDLSKVCGSLESLSHMSTRLADMNVTVLDKIVSGVFGKVRREFCTKWRDMPVPSDADVFTLVRQLTSWIKETLIAHALPILENFVASSQAHQAERDFDGIVDRIRDMLLAFWTDVANDMVNATVDVDTTGTVSLNHVLLLSRLALEWSKGSIESVFSMYAERILADVLHEQSPTGYSSAGNTGSRYHSNSSPLRGRGLSTTQHAGYSQYDSASSSSNTSVAQRPMPRMRGHGGSHQGSPATSSFNIMTMVGETGMVRAEADLMIRAQEIAASYRATAQRLLTRYVEIHIARMSWRIHVHTMSLARSSPDYDTVQEVSVVWRDIAAEIDCMDQQLRRGLEEETNPENRRKSADVLKRNKTTLVSGMNSSAIKASGSGLFLTPGSAASGGGGGASSAGLSRTSSVRHTPSASANRMSPFHPNLATTLSTSFAPIPSPVPAAHPPPQHFDSLLSDIDRLFQERIEYLPQRVDLTRVSAVTTTTKVVIKTWIETLRQSVLPSTTSYHQVQIDVAFLRARLWSYVSDERVLMSLLDSCLQSAHGRVVSEGDVVALDSIVRFSL